MSEPVGAACSIQEMRQVQRPTENVMQCNQHSPIAKLFLLTGPLVRLRPLDSSLGLGGAACGTCEESEGRLAS